MNKKFNHITNTLIALIITLIALFSVLHIYKNIQNNLLDNSHPGNGQDDTEIPLQDLPENGDDHDMSENRQSLNEDPVPSPADAPKPDESPVENVIMTTDQVFTFVDGEVIWLSITEEQLKEYAQILRKELKLNDAAIAGILSNIQAESGFNPNKVGDLGEAYGICQWHGPRMEQMSKYCEEKGYNPISMEGQLQFLIYDLQNNYIYPYDLLLACNDSEQGAVQATYYFCAYYESPSDVESISPERERLTKLLIYPKLNEFSQPQ